MLLNAPRRSIISLQQRAEFLRAHYNLKYFVSNIFFENCNICKRMMRMVGRMVGWMVYWMVELVEWMVGRMV